MDMVYNKRFASEYDIIRTYNASVDHIRTHGLPYFISFYNDLGVDNDGNLAPDGLSAAK